MNDERSDESFEAAEPMYAERDEHSGYRATAGGKPARGGGAAGRVLALLALLGVAGLGWLAWQQDQQLRALGDRFANLQARLDTTGETLSESGASLTSRIEDQNAELETHWSEIKKLWGVANDRNRPAIEQQGKTLARLEDELKKLQQEVNRASASAREAREAVAAVRAQMAGLVTSVEGVQRQGLAGSAALDELKAQVAQARTGVGRLDEQVRGLRERLDRSAAENRQALTSIDTFRRETNLQLQAIREQLSSP